MSNLYLLVVLAATQRPRPCAHVWVDGWVLRQRQGLPWSVCSGVPCRTAASALSLISPNQKVGVCVFVCDFYKWYLCFHCLFRLVATTHTRASPWQAVVHLSRDKRLGWHRSMHRGAPLSCTRSAGCFPKQSHGYTRGWPVAMHARGHPRALQQA